MNDENGSIINQTGLIINQTHKEIEDIEYLFSQTYGNPQIKTIFGTMQLINADSTASGFPCKLIDNYLTKHILPYYNNTHSNSYTGRLMHHYIQETKKIIKKSYNLKADDKIIFTGSGCSGAIVHLIHALNLKEDNPTVLVTITEHHSNYLPWKHQAVNIKFIKINETGLIDIDDLNKTIKSLKSKNFIASFSACSNVIGVHQNVSEINKLIHKKGGKIFWDYAASAPYVEINMNMSQRLKGDDQSKGAYDYMDAIFISVHKFFGGPGAPGLLIAKKSLFKNKEPFYPSGGTVQFVCPRYTVYTKDIEKRETGGTPNIIGCIRTGLVFQLKNKYQDFINAREKQLTKYVQGKLVDNENIILLNPSTNLDRLPIFSFIIPNMHYNLVVVLMNDLFGISCRGGVSCCSIFAQYILHLDCKAQDHIKSEILSDKGNPKNYGWCRVSFHYIMPMRVVDFIVNAIIFIANNNVKYKKYYKYIKEKNIWIPKKNKKINDTFANIKFDLINQ